MEWLKELLVEHSALQAVVVISLISTIGIGLGKIRFFRDLARHGLHLLRGHSGRAFRPLARPGDADLRRKFRTGDLRLRSRFAGGTGFLQFDARRRTAARLSRHRHRAARNGPGHGDELRLRGLDARHVGHSVRRNDQHPGAGRRAADAATNGHRRQRSCAELRRGLPARRRGRDSGRGLPAQALRAPLRHAGTRRRAPQERLHRQLPPHQSRGLRQERPRNRDAEPPPFRHLAPVARRPGFDPHLGQDPAGERRDPGHHHARRSRRPAADLRRTGDQGLEHGKHRLERRRQPAHLAAHPRDAPRNQRQETLAAAPAEYLRHQHQPRLPLGRAAAGHPPTCVCSWATV